MKPYVFRHARPLAAALVLLFFPLPLLAQEDAPSPEAQPLIVDRTLGEEEQILRRVEWFYSTRRAGTTSDEGLSALRADAVRFTERAIELQRERRAAGIDEETNFWTGVGPSPSTFGGWTFGNVSGRVSALDADWASGTLYLATASGGLWKSLNDGASWESVFDAAGTMTVGTVTIDPNDPQVVWAGTGENNQGCESYFGLGLLRSVDGGQTWEPRNGEGSSSLEDLSSFADIVVDPRNSSRLVVGGRIRGCSDGSALRGGIYTSDDAGLTWQKRLGNVPVYEIAQDPVVLDTLWAATDDGIYKSVDGGNTWTQQTASGLPAGSTGRTELAVSPSNPSVVYALFAGGGAELWRTTNGGASWDLRASGGDACDGQCWYNMVLRTKVDDPDTLYRGTIRLFESTDGGATPVDLIGGWGSAQKVHQDIHVLLMHPDQPDTFYVGGDGGLWKTTDGGANFTNLNGNLNITQFYDVGVHPTDLGIVCGGSQDNSSLARAGTSDVWDLQQVTGDGFVCAINPLDPNYSYITSYPNSYPAVYRSTTGVFGSYSVISGSGSGVNAGDRSNWVTPYVLDPAEPSTLYLGTQRVYRSDDHGTTWVPKGPSDMTNGGTLFALEVNRSFTSIVYAGSTDGRLWRSTNKGETWEDITAGLPARSINDIAGDPASASRAFAVVGGFNTAHLWEWNEGEGWVERGDGLPNVPANAVLLLSSEDIVVGTDTGVFRSSDGGMTFEPYMNGLPQGLVVTELEFDAPQQTLTAGTYGRGAWQVRIDSVEPIVIFDELEQPLVEVDGDGDASIEPGETWELRPRLRNAGGLDALAVTARLATATPGVRILEPTARGYGDIAGGTSAPPLEPFRFVVEPSFDCGGVALFDLVDIRSSNPPGEHADQLAAFSLEVVGSYEDPLTTTLVDENFDAGAGPAWTHEAVDPGLWFCWGLEYRDEWKVIEMDPARGLSYHCGEGPGGSYIIANYSWLYYGGKDSAGGEGVLIPADAAVATLTLVHRYDTEAGQDGGQVVIDAVDDGQDVYQPLKPEGGYPGGSLRTGYCNGLEGKKAFQGSSGGFVTDTFDLTRYAGQRVHIAFVFGSDREASSGFEGWTIDEVRIESQDRGTPVCQATTWPGALPATASFARLGTGEIEASWEPACNADAQPGQSYAILSGDLAALATEGTYGHSVLADDCARTSPSVFMPGTGQEYYLVLSHEQGRESAPGTSSAGAPRPPAPNACAPLVRTEACP